MVTSDVHDPFKSIFGITELIGNNNEDFKADKRTIGKNANDNFIVSTNIHGKKKQYKGSKDYKSLLFCINC